MSSLNRSDSTAHLGRVDGLMARARRWCPDASEQDLREAVLRMAFETAHGRGLADSWGLPAPAGLPTGAVRDLMEAAATLLEQEEPWEWPESKETPHPSGFGRGPDNFCAQCAWHRDGSCVQADLELRTTRSWPASTRACARWEPKELLEDCRACGACCREGYTFAPVDPDESVIGSHPQLVTKGSDGGFRLERPGGLCVALDRASSSGRYPCAIYPHRPRACADLLPGSQSCLVARRRLGLSR